MNIRIGGIDIEDVEIVQATLRPGKFFIRYTNPRKRDRIRKEGHDINYFWDIIRPSSALGRLIELAEELSKCGYRACQIERTVMVDWVSKYLEISKDKAVRYYIALIMLGL